MTDAHNNTIRENLTIQDLKPIYVTRFPNGTKQYIPSSETFLTCLDDFTKDPSWIFGNKPSFDTGYIKNSPSLLIVVDKGNGWVDAFWFYFYAFNQGPFVMSSGPWGSHLGDWEHTLVRFHNGVPKYVRLSAHSGGDAYRFTSLEKLDTMGGVERRVIFSAYGTHANYASSGQFSHDLPSELFFMPLSDFTDRGRIWDPLLNFYAYRFDGVSFWPQGEREKELGVEWLYWMGRWGDEQLPLTDPRQTWFPIVQWKYVVGPKGPLFKQLDRLTICGNNKSKFRGGCFIRKLIKRGSGFEATEVENTGDGCGVLLYKIRPKWLRSIFRFFLWRGIVCYLMDYYTG